VTAFNRRLIEEFRANGGRVGGPFEGARLLLLTTTGARTGAPHTTPLGHLPDGGDRVLVIASAGGAPHHPDWYHNLLADPAVTVEDGVFTYRARAEVLRGAERDRLFARAVEADPGWGEYQARTTRVLPVVALHAVGDGPPDAGPGPFYAVLRRVHEAFRRELRLVRAETAAAGPRLGAQLRVNCLTLCQGLRNHHGGEDAGLFPALHHRRPELAPVLDRLRDEHEKIAALLAELSAVIGAEGTSPAEALREVERLTDELEAHLTYEETALLPLLDQG
jgi:deazaflavin-dependent oxidoreductase (nitroreductase family)